MTAITIDSDRLVERLQAAGIDDDRARLTVALVVSRQLTASRRVTVDDIRRAMAMIAAP